MTIFYITVPISEDSRVQYNSPTVKFTTGTTSDLTWLPELVVPLLETNSYKVNAELYALEDGTDTWKKMATLASNVPNSGALTVTIPELTCLACSVSIKISLSGAASPQASATEALISYFTRVMPGIWTPVGFYSKPSPNQYSQCSSWSSAQSQGVGRGLKDVVEPCPPTEAMALLDHRFAIETEFVWGALRSGASSCFRQLVQNRFVQ